jgi:hypothetical protein
MTDRKVFGSVVRLFGVFVAVYYGTLNIVTGIASWLAPTAMQSTPAHRVVYGALALASSFPLIKADWLVRFAYGRESREV